MHNLDLSQKIKLIQISGDDSEIFLNSQLTQDIKTLNTERACLFAYCSPKGRMLANGVIYKKNQNYYMLVEASIIGVFVKKISMYILRSKVKINIVDNSAYSLSYKKIENLPSEHAFLSSIEKENTYYISWFENKHIVINYHDNINIENNNLDNLYLDLDEFTHDSIQHGLFFINSQNTETYVPQMLNFEKLGGVSFKKGCYPGQEIVARSQYLGKIKKTSIYASLELEGSNIDISNLPIEINSDNKQNNLEQPQIIELVTFQNKLHLLLCIRAEYLLLDNLTLTILAKNLEYKLYFKD